MEGAEIALSCLGSYSFRSFHHSPRVHVQGHVWMMGLQEEKVGGTSGLIAEETGILAVELTSLNRI